MDTKETTIQNFYEKGIYLGSIDWEGCERYPVIRHPKFEKPISAFSSDLSFLMCLGGELVYSKNQPENVGQALTLDHPMFDGAYKGELTPGREVHFIFDGYVEGVVPRGKEEKRLFLKNEEPLFSQGESIVYVPESLEGIEIISGRSMGMTGQIVAEADNSFIVDAGVYVFFDNRKGENYKMGDWVEGGLGQIELMDI